MQIKRAGFPILLLACHLSPVFGQDKPVPALSVSLRDAIRLALSQGGNLAIDVADQSVAAAEARFQLSRAATKPGVDFSFNATNQRLNLDVYGFQSIQEQGFTFPRVAGPFNVLEFRLHARQSIFDLETTRRKESAKAGILAARTQTDEVRDQIAARVARLYFQAQRDASAVEAARTLIVTAESNLKETGNHNAEGEALGLDVAQARIDVAAAKQNLLRAELERARTEIELLNAMNRDLSTPLRLTEPLAFVTQEIPPADQAVATALQTRGEILALEQKLRVTRLDDAAIHAERLPTVVGYADGGSTGISLPASQGTYDAGVTVRVPIFDGGRRESQRAEVAAGIRELELQLAQQRKQVEIEVREALLQMDLVRGNVELSESRYKAAENVLEHRQRLHAQGLGSQMDVNSAQADLARAADSRMAALNDWNAARVDLLQALGTVRTMSQ